MTETARVLDVDLPPRQSAFLWGARKTGKSTYLRHRFPDSLRFDLLDSDLVIDLLRRPALLRERLLIQPERLLAKPVIIDEVQKVPELLDEVHRLIAEPRGEQFGHALEHFILMELAAHASYRELHYDIHYWRTRSGLEVDFILGAGEVAVEVKGSSHVRDRELRPLRAFVQEHRPRAALVVSAEPAERVVGGIRIVPWECFLRRLWAGRIIA